MSPIAEKGFRGHVKIGDEMKKFIDFGNAPNLKRNILLAIYLSLIIIINCGTAGLYIMNVVGIADRSAFLPLWMVIYGAFICFANVIFAIAIWNWQRWGVIGYVLLSLVSFIITSISTGSLSNFLGIIGASILILLVLPYWKLMK